VTDVTVAVLPEDVPDWLAEAVATAAHQRACADVPVGTAGPVRGHMLVHIVTAKSYMADLMNAFGVAPADFDWLMDGPG
jgi:hypothetical protein